MADTVTILGKQHIAKVPSFGLREELCLLWATHGSEGGHRALRVYSAAVGLSCGVGAQAGADMRRSAWDVLAYGDTVYSWLREQGATTPEIVKVGVDLLTAMAGEVFPREEEVNDRVGFSEGDEAGQTSLPPA